MGFFAVATLLFQMRQTGKQPVSFLPGQAGNVSLFSNKNLRRYLVVVAAMALAVGWADVGGLSLQILPASAHQAGTATSSATWTAKDIRRPPQGHVLAKHMPRWRPGHSMPVLDTHTCPNWAVITSIFGPTKLTIQLSRAVHGGCTVGWCTVVVGDRKSPAKGEWMQAFESKGGNATSLHYLSPAEQDALPFATARAVPWNHFGRKNVGYLHAIPRGATVIYDTDEDNELLEPDPGGRLSDAAAAIMSDTARCDWTFKITSKHLKSRRPFYTLSLPRKVKPRTRRVGCNVGLAGGPVMPVHGCDPVGRVGRADLLHEWWRSPVDQTEDDDVVRPVGDGFS